MLYKEPTRCNFGSIDLFHLPALFFNNMYVTLQSSTCFEH